MKVKEFKDKFSLSPIDVIEIAEQAVKITDDPNLKKVAQNLIDSHESLIQEFARIDFEIG